jgi:3-methylcrotonyl-CoA carboxylase alpha subunit
MFAKLLIANRGEIACRIIATAKRLGIATVAVYSDADAGSLHVAMASEAYRIGPAPARESYLRGEAIIAVARRAGADAIHPGYGFLSENAAFAEDCAAAGLVFVGPPPAAIRAMGDKAAAKMLMQQAGVPLVPGYHGAAQDTATLLGEARRIGYPVLIKASAGGGGRGMRVVADEGDFTRELAAAQRESRAAFGDDRVLIERYLQRPRHIEVQVFADSLGSIVHLFERDCSIQRRHQKVIEEAPAPLMTAELRKRMTDAAVAAARAVGYVGAGTVEFIVEHEQFHFMEMNTRLQVEHPVTEMITGLDLVEWQLRVAAGEPLPLSQDAIRLSGHAIQARIYAEDPSRDFLPSVGSLTHLRAPEASADVRIDTGVRRGDAISPYYDAMIAKLIVHGEDRAQAVRRLQASLQHYEVADLQTNLRLLRGIAEHPEFAAAALDTGFIPRHSAILLAPAPQPRPAIVHAAVFALLDSEADTTGWTDPWAATDSWRLNMLAWQKLLLRTDAADLTLQVRRQGNQLFVLRDGVAESAILQRDGFYMRVCIDGETQTVCVLRDGRRVTVIARGENYRFESVDLFASPDSDVAGGGRILAPIPGRIATVLVAKGAAVARGQALVVLEAMKMELTITAERDGIVAALHCAAGDLVREGHELVEISSAAAT